MFRPNEHVSDWFQDRYVCYQSQQIVVILHVNEMETGIYMDGKFRKVSNFKLNFGGNVCTHEYTNTYIHERMHACTHARTHARTHTHTHTNIYHSSMYRSVHPSFGWVQSGLDS